MTATRLDIAICTFRRSHICQTLASVAKVRVPSGFSVRVIVADNDDTPSAEKRVKDCPLPFELTYLHAPARNISIARNAWLDTSTAPVLVFIDDDEVVAEDWLTELVAEQSRSGAEVVLGPAIALYDDMAPDWMKVADYHSSRPVYVNGEIVTGYGCNTLLMRTAPSVDGVRFERDAGKLGGEDTLYLAAIHRRGGKISYASEALVYEDVPPNRARLGWLLRRKLRFGHTHAVMLEQNGDLTFARRARQMALAVGKGSYCALMALLTLPIRSERNRWLIRGALHAGVCVRIVGLRPRETYGLDQPA